MSATTMSPSLPGASVPVDGPRSGRRGLVLLGLSAAAGVALQAYVGYRGRVSGTPPALLFWVSLTLIYGVGLALTLGTPMTRSERALAVSVVAVAMQLTRIVLYPDMFVYHDELVHVRVLGDILIHHHLFTANSSLPVTPRYPGLEVATAALARLTGLSAHTSGSMVLVLARVILTLGMFLIVERITNSSRVAAAACLVYVANPQYLFFNSQFSYQTLALPLSVGYVYLIHLLAPVRRSIALPVLLVCAVAVAASHHLTAMGLAVLLVIWTLVSALMGRRQSHLLAATLIVLLSVASWAALAHSTVFPYFSEIARHNIHSVQQLISGRSHHAFFKDTAGDRTPVWERYASLASVVVIVGLLPWALLASRGWVTKRNAAAVVLCAIAVAYPVIPLGHLTDTTSEVADRSSGFIFAGVAFVLACWAFLHLRQSWLARRPRVAGLAVLLTAVILFVGGTIVGSGPPWLRAPGRYLVSSENRSVDPLTLAASRWLGAHMAPDQRIYADRINALLASAVGQQHSVTSLGDHIDNGATSRLLLAPPSSSDRSIVRLAKLALLLVDTRIAQDLPHVGVYTDSGEYGSDNRTRPPTTAAVTKFDSVPGVDRVYDGGAIRIYWLKGMQ